MAYILVAICKAYLALNTICNKSAIKHKDNLMLMTRVSKKRS